MEQRAALQPAEQPEPDAIAKPQPNHAAEPDAGQSGEIRRDFKVHQDSTELSSRSPADDAAEHAGQLADDADDAAQCPAQHDWTSGRRHQQCRAETSRTAAPADAEEQPGSGATAAAPPTAQSQPAADGRVHQTATAECELMEPSKWQKF